MRPVNQQVHGRALYVGVEEQICRKVMAEAYLDILSEMFYLQAIVYNDEHIRDMTQDELCQR